MVSFIKPEKKDFILEIGAGLGTLTASLAKRAGHVLALEIDKRAVSVLTGKFKAQENIKILNQDFLFSTISLLFLWLFLLLFRLLVWHQTLLFLEVLLYMPY